MIAFETKIEIDQRRHITTFLDMMGTFSKIGYFLNVPKIISYKKVKQIFAFVILS